MIFYDLTFGMILFLKALAKEDTDAAVQSILYRENYIMKVRIGYKVCLKYFFIFNVLFIKEFWVKFKVLGNKESRTKSTY